MPHEADTNTTVNEVDERRFYIAPMISFAQFTEENTFDPDSAEGITLAFGRTICDYFAVEVFASGLEDAPLKAQNRSGEIDTRGYGLAGLIFPMRGVFPIFILLGYGVGEYQFSGPDVGHLNSRDLELADFGAGFLLPVDDLLGIDLAIRAEYRYRDADVDAKNGGTFQFRNEIVSVGVQIPI